MITVGVTGGIGSGKSTVCSIFEELGATIFDSDSVAKDIMNTDKHVKFKISFNFGSECYRDGKLDTKHLASQIFNNPEKMKIVESIVHPKVYERFEEEKKKKPDVLIMESALLFQTGYHKNLDKTIVVVADLDSRIARAMKRDGSSYADVKKRIKNQVVGMLKADHIINNDISITLPSLKKTVKNFYKKYLSNETEKVQEKDKT